MVIRFRVGTNHPTRRLNLHVYSISPLPKSYSDAFIYPNWQNAMSDEFNALIKNDTWTLVPRPMDANIFVLCGYFVINFSAVVKSGTIQTILSLATSRHWPIHQLDVKNVFLHTVSLWAEAGPSGVVLAGTHTAYLLVLYVDDIVLTASSKTLLQQIIALFHQEFSMTDLGSLNYFLCISVTRDSSGMFLSQQKYDVEILERAHMVNCNLSQTPIETESKLGDDGDRVSNPTLYRSLTGSLQYLTFTRPDISYAVQQPVCVVVYVRGTLDHGLQLFSSTTTSLVAYSDADWAGCPTTRRSTSGYCVFLGNNLLSWSSKRQPTLSRSSAEAEYRGVVQDLNQKYLVVSPEVESPEMESSEVESSEVEVDRWISGHVERWSRGEEVVY
ncbi:ribonuclease H-like domain-containing protein [Tanacetum coccineum]